MCVSDQGVSVSCKETVMPESLIGLLQKCRRSRDPHEAKQLYSYMRQHRLDSHPVLGNHLVPLLVECGSLPHAQHVFDRLPHWTEISWTSLMTGYIDCGQPRHAFHLYVKMQMEDSIQPSRFTFVALLNACAQVKDADKGRELHADIASRGLERELYVCSTLVDMYAKCGFLAEACIVFDGLPARNVVSWNILISGYAEHGLIEEVRGCVSRMQLDAIAPDSFTFVCSLKACAKLGAVDTGQEIHSEISKAGLEKETFLGNILVDMYAKGGLLAEARQVFKGLPARNAIAWTAMIAGYNDHGLPDEAQRCFQQMQLDGISPDSITFVCCLKACATTGALETGQEIHVDIIRRGLESELYVGTSLVDMYIVCGRLAEAQQMFDRLTARSIVSWDALIAGYAEHGLYEEVLHCFHRMQLENVSPDAVTFVCSLKACRVIEKGQQLHAEITKRGLERELRVGSTLVDMYSKCSSLAEAHKVLELLPVRNSVTWNALISGYAQQGLSEKVEACYQQLWSEGVAMDIATFVGCLRACNVLETGREIHAEVLKRGLEGQLYLGSSLVNMYAKCNSLAEAHKVFKYLPSRDAVSWATLITGCTEHGLGAEAGVCLEHMQQDGISPDSVMYVCTLKACGNTRTLEVCREVHADLTIQGVETELLVANTLVDTYIKCGSLIEARKLFDRQQVQDTVTWNALFAGYAEYGLDEELLNCFKKMQLQNISADAITYTLCLKACGNLGALETGRGIHAAIRDSGAEGNLSLGNILIDMYGKCGSAKEGWDVFNKMHVRDVVSWSAMIKAYGENHEGNMAVQCFEDMLEQGVKPDSITFASLLSACSHASLISKGQKYFVMMKEEYEIEPTLDHYACIIDLLARSGYIRDAERFLAGMQSPPSSIILMAVLSACKSYGEVELGQRCFQQLVQMNEEDASAYMLMAEMYASAGRWSDASKIEEMRNHARAKKKPGSALIEAGERLHEFVVGFNQSEYITALLGVLHLHMKDDGYVPNLDFKSKHTLVGNKAAAPEFVDNSSHLIGNTGISNFCDNFNNTFRPLSRLIDVG